MLDFDINTRHLIKLSPPEIGMPVGQESNRQLILKQPVWRQSSLLDSEHVKAIAIYSHIKVNAKIEQL